jgi:hypothetical protein
LFGHSRDFVRLDWHGGGSGMKEILGVLIPVIIIPESMVWFLMVMHLHDHPGMMSEKEVRSRRTLLFACHAIICIGLMILLWRFSL